MYGIRFCWIHVSIVRLEKPRNSEAPYLSKTSRSGPGVFVVATAVPAGLSGFVVAIAYRWHKRRANAYFYKSPLLFIKVGDFALVFEILQCGAGEDFPPFSARVLFREDNAVAFHHCSDCGLCRAFAGA
jgi:hypothetical protein